MSAAAGALNFTLGLQANQFLNSLGVASGKLIGFLGVANGIQLAFGKMWAAIEKGGELKDIAASASITVEQLYKLQRGFKDVGASADAVPSVIRKLRRTLAEGGEANSVLASLGLDPAAIARLDPAAQFEQIAAALAKVNVNARSQAATKLFGREGAATMEQIANSGNDFAEAMQRASSDAGVWQNVSTAFDSISDQVSEFQARLETMWALLAGSLIQAFKEGQLAETITDIIVTGFQAGLAIVPGLFLKLGEVLLRVFQVPLAYLQAGIEYVIDQALNNPMMSKLALLAPGGAGAAAFAAGGTGSAPATFEQILAERLAEGVRFNLGSGEYGLGDISDSVNGILGDGFATAKDLFAGLADRLGALIGRLPQSDSAAGGQGGAGFSSNKLTRPDVTALEKIGLVIGRGGVSSDYARQTADATRQSATSLKNIERKLILNEPPDFSNLS